MSAYLLAMVSIGLINVLLALGLTLQFGRVGLINFGHIGFFAVGAYGSALPAMAWGLPLWLTVPLGAILAALAAVPLGMISIRLRGDYFAVVTLGFSEAVRYVIISESWLTGGVQGIPGVPVLFSEVSGNTARQGATAALILAVVTLGALVLWRVATSPFGRVIEAIRDDEVAVRALGKYAARFKNQAFAIGAGFAGIAGALYGHYIGYLSPDQFMPVMTFYIWMAVIMGGAGRVSGAIVGTVILTLFLEGSRFMRDFLPGIAEVEMASIRTGVIGLALILFTIYMPRGLMGDYSRR